MEIKTIEIRDSGTFIPALAIRVSGADGYLFRRAGFGPTPLVILVRLADMGASFDPYDWPGGARTMTVAHESIAQHWAELKSGDVVDVEFVLGETPSPKVSERAAHVLD
jgi:hypothetical protein